MSDYKAKFNEYITAFIKAVEDGAYDDRSERVTAVELLIDRYVAAYGKTPDSNELERLADVILREELISRLKNKSAIEEYPFISERQLLRRHNNETSLKQAEEYDTKGTNRAKPSRRKRSKYENITVEKYAKARNKESRRKYRRFTKEQPVVTRKVDPATIERYLNAKYTFWQRKFA